MHPRGFASDNYAGAHPEVLQAVAAASVDHAPAYGADPWTARAHELIRARLGAHGAAPGRFDDFVALLERRPAPARLRGLLRARAAAVLAVRRTRR